MTALLECLMSHRYCKFSLYIQLVHFVHLEHMNCFWSNSLYYISGNRFRCFVVCRDVWSHYLSLVLYATICDSCQVGGCRQQGRQRGHVHSKEFLVLQLCIATLTHSINPTTCVNTPFSNYTHFSCK